MIPPPAALYYPFRSNTRPFRATETTRACIIIPRRALCGRALSCAAGAPGILSDSGWWQLIFATALRSRYRITMLPGAPRTGIATPSTHWSPSIMHGRHIPAPRALAQPVRHTARQSSAKPIARRSAARCTKGTGSAVCCAACRANTQYHRPCQGFQHIC